ncbi:MAG TPA: Gfo/Idh/MocA family oxidoreductase [Isosphaeraceae bacterium]|jgi:predicted dehydrogenase
MRDVRIGVIGCGHAARVHLGRLAAVEGVHIVACADPDPGRARALADLASIPAFADHAELIRQTSPDALAVFTPHLAHYRPTIDGLQAGCHVFVEKPLSTNVQEAVDIVNVARARERKVAVGHQFRLLPSLREARRRLAEGAIGPVRLVVATLAQPWLSSHRNAEDSWRFDPKAAGAGMLADSGDHLIDALLWSLGRKAVEAAAIQSRLESGLDIVTAAAVRLADGIPATIGLAGDAPRSLFEISYIGERGRLWATEDTLIQDSGGAPGQVSNLPAPIETIDGNFVAAIRGEAPLCCPADEALDTVRLLEAIARSAASGQVVRLG